jgi:hypothetical protein
MNLSKERFIYAAATGLINLYYCQPLIVLNADEFKISRQCWNHRPRKQATLLVHISNQTRVFDLPKREIE